jgi:hypothetical protein
VVAWTPAVMCAAWALIRVFGLVYAELVLKR